MADRQVIIFDYDEGWVARFGELEGELRGVLGGSGGDLTGVEHIGSTAVAGLAAKNIIDILIGVGLLEIVNDKWVPILQGLGYRYIAEYEVDLPMRRYFVREAGECGARIGSHLHIVEPGSGCWREHIGFRDYLRGHREVASEYEELKKGLADQFRFRRKEYTEGKGEFIAGVIEKVISG